MKQSSRTSMTLPLNSIHYPFYLKSTPRDKSTISNASLISMISMNLPNISNDIILIVEDNKYLRNSVCLLTTNYLLHNKSLNFEVISCNDGIDMLHLIKNDRELFTNKIKIIITDENMDYMCGSTAIKLIRELEYCKKIERIFISSLTAFSDDESIKSILSKGANMIIEKPLTNNKLDLLFENFIKFK